MYLYDIFILINVCLLEDIKKFNMDMLVKIGSFQIKQNVLKLKSTLPTVFVIKKLALYTLLVAMLLSLCIAVHTQFKIF